MSSSEGPFTPRFREYFEREVARKAAQPLSRGAEIEFQIAEPNAPASETFAFRRTHDGTEVVPGPGKSPQVVFLVPSAAAEQILSDPSEDIGSIGVNIAKLILSSDHSRRIGIQIKAGFLSLMSHGYFGVVTAGGSSFASFLASRGLGGMGAIKNAFNKLKG